MLLTDASAAKYFRQRLRCHASDGGERVRRRHLEREAARSHEAGDEEGTDNETARAPCAADVAVEPLVELVARAAYIR